MNIYELFIKNLEDQTIKDEYFEYHHIIPKHKGGTNDESNLIKLTYRQHILAHLLLYRIYNRPEDLAAYRLMRGISCNKKQEIGKMIGEKHKQSGHIYKLGNKNKQTNWINNIKTKDSLSKGGKVAGRIAKETGQILSIRTTEYCRQGGVTQGNKAKVSGQIQSLGKYKGLYVLIMPDGREFQHAFEAEEVTGISAKVIISRCKQNSLGFSRRDKTKEELDNRWRV